MRQDSAASLTASLAVILLLLGGTSVLPGRTAEATPPVASTQHFDLKIVALVDYLLLPEGLGCDYGQGSADLAVGRSNANVSLSVQGDVAGRAYSVVMITNDGNFSIGTMDVNDEGNGTFNGGAKLGIGPTALSEVAIRLYFVGKVPAGCFSLDLVGLPFPVIVSGSSSTTMTSASTWSSTCKMCISTSTTTASTATRTTSISSTQSSTGSRVSTSSRTSTSTESSGGTATTTTGANTNASRSLVFKLVSLPDWLLLPKPLNYPFQSGTATVTIAGNALHVELAIAGSANTRFIVELHANGLNITLGTVSTTNGGASYLTTDAHLDNGTYLIGIRVYQAAQASAMMTESSLVGVSIPLAEPVVIGSGAVTSATTSTTTPATTSATTAVTSTSATTSTTTPATTTSTSTTTSATGPATSGATTRTATTTQTSAVSSNPSQNDFSYFSLNLVGISAAPAGYVRGSGTVDMDLRGGVLDVSVQLDHANPNTKYAVVLELGKSNITLGTFVTNMAGDAELDAEVPSGTGTYATSVLVYDDSSFNAPTLVMNGASDHVSITSVSSGSTAVSTQTLKPDIIPAGASTISTAEANGTIPAEVQISSYGQQFDIIDHNFSVSVGRISNSGVAITVSGQNVTGPRTLLIYVNGSMAQSITSGSFEILFDGQQISEASSLSAVLSPQPGAPATYAVVQTSSGVQLLVSVPHFSTHVIEILGVSFQSVKNLLDLSLPELAGAIVVVTLVFGAIYISRRRV